jgi:pyruvate formate lyase activating enzyme
VLRKGVRGLCRARANLDGRLYTLTYGDISSISFNPIEKKPFYHFWPGSVALTIGTWGCNFMCKWCQNWTISQASPDPAQGHYRAPEELVELALKSRCEGVSVSFNEPTLLYEYMLALFPLAKRRRLYTNIVSNGYLSPEALRELVKAGLDAIKVDVKGPDRSVARWCGARGELVWATIELARKLGLHLEVVNLLVTGVNDAEQDVRWVAERLLDLAGPDTPLHLTRFFPAYRVVDRPPTPLIRLEAGWRAAREVGLRYVYLGNVPSHPYENTYCPQCDTLLLERRSLALIDVNLAKGNKCPKCGERIPIVGAYRVRDGEAWAVLS